MKKPFKSFLQNEDGIVNTAGGGNIAGLGIGAQGDPGGNPNAFLFKKKKRKLSDILRRMPPKA